MAEGARLLIECGVKSFTEGSNPSVSASAPLAQLDRASGYGPEGQEFESLRVYSSLQKVSSERKRLFPFLIEFFAC